MAQGSNPDIFELNGGNVGVLILTESASPQDNSYQIAHGLHRKGRSVYLSSPIPEVRNWGDLREADWLSWLENSQNLLAKLHERCESVFIVGISMGSALALRFAELFGDDVDGLIIIEPSFPNIRRSQRDIWRLIRSELHLIGQPLIQMYSTEERNEFAQNSQIIAENISSPFIREVVLEHLPDNLPIIESETAEFIDEVVNGFWLTDIENLGTIAEINDTELIDAEFLSIVESLSLDESMPTTYLDELDKFEAMEGYDHFEEPNPQLIPLADPRKRRAILAMVLAPIYTFVATITYFDPLGIEPWPGILAFIGGLAYFFYSLRDTPADDDGVIL